jgi:hypothetical protein
MLYNFCTLFDRNYASRGLALYRSLERVCMQEFRLTILCIDEETRDLFTRLALPRVRLLTAEDLGDPELLEVRKTRPRREFCWTCTGPLMLALLRQAGSDEIVTYLDSDLLFFSDLQPVYDELGDKDIFIHGHRFSARYQSYAAASGVFNVGLIAVRNAPQGIACLARWRAQCLEVCELDPAKGYCGDQKYLDEWPSLYSELATAEHPGIALAPWNVEGRAITKRGGKVMVDGQPLIFYHYHGLRIILTGPRRWLALPAIGYRFTLEERRLIYRPYVRMLREAQEVFDRVAPGVVPKPKLSISPRQFRDYCRSWQLFIA